MDYGQLNSKKPMQVFRPEGKYIIARKTGKYAGYNFSQNGIKKVIYINECFISSPSLKK